MRALSRICRDLTDRLWSIRQQPSLGRLLRQVHDEVSRATGQERTERELIETISQSLLQASVTWNRADPRLHRASQAPGFALPNESILGQLLSLVICAETASDLHCIFSRDVVNLLEAANHLLPRHSQNGSVNEEHENRFETDGVEFDRFLNAHDRRGRFRQGVFFTPLAMAAFVVREIDKYLQTEFDLGEGLADRRARGDVIPRNSAQQAFAHSPFVNVLDPAVGAGVFLVAWIDRARKKKVGSEAWNDYVHSYLLPNLHGIDLLLPACITAWLKVAEKLAVTGYRFESPANIDIRIGNALRGPAERDARQQPPASIVIGNPPFSALTTSSNPWIDQLLRETSLHGNPVGSFYEVDGVPLGEKKLWLHDDYVKFLRFAQSQIEEAGAGIAGLITNHGYLDNLTFRGVRRSLMKSFARIAIVDLHGGRKKREVAPNRLTDENVFNIDQGVAVALLRKPSRTLEPEIIRTDLWGPRDQKLAKLSGGDLPEAASVAPVAPRYLFTADRDRSRTAGEYERGFPLNSIMPIHSTAAVTARDSFVVAFTQDELLQRMRSLANDSLTDEQLRQRYFSRTRSSRYASGDTRGWKLNIARDHARGTDDFARSIRYCSYRPFDQRYVFWADWMIDWPRNEVMGHMLTGDNLALVTRRQMIPNQPGNYFFISDSIVIDGLIRSDNRGSESFFPLYVTDEHGIRSPNFAADFLNACLDVDTGAQPEDIFGAVYAQFHSSVYRERYQAEFCFDFPRVFVPRTAVLFQALASLGKRLIATHRLENPKANSNYSYVGLAGNSPSPVVPKRDWPQFRDDTLWITNDCGLRGVTENVWQFQIGGHQVCKKWLRDRAGRTLDASDLQHFRRIVSAIGETHRLVKEIDDAITLAGGWPRAFL